MSQVTIGTVIASVRRKIPDPLPTLPQPAASFAVILTPPGQPALLTPGTYFAKATQLNSYGETLPSTESALLTVGVGQSIQCISALLPGAITLRVYLTLVGGASNTEIGFQDFPSSPGIITFAPTNASQPPVVSTAVLPDADGQTFSVNAVFDWLNNGLNELSHAVGGLLDYCGVATLAGNGLYVIPGQWLSITDVWYGGYWIKGGRRAEYFRRNTVTSNVLQMATISITTGQQVIEVTYQPDRNSGSTTTTNTMGPNDNVVGIVNPNAFLLPFGFAQIGTEIVAYSQLGPFTGSGAGYGQGGYGQGGYGGGIITGPAMAGLIRGVGNTVAQMWPTGTVVNELSLFWNGRRIFDTAYAPGSSATPLPIPRGWIPILETYMLAQAKKGEQDMDTAAKLEQAAFTAAEKWMYANKEIPTGMQVGGNNNPVVYDQTVAGGILIP